MARPKSIRITKNDRKEYAKLVKNTKAKIRRTVKNYGIDLTKEIELPNLEAFTSRKQFNEWKQKASSFTNRNNQHYQFVKGDMGVVLSKAEITKYKIELKRAQRLIDKMNKEQAKKPLLSGGKVIGSQGQEMLQMSESKRGFTRPKDFNINKIPSRQRFEEMRKNVRKRSNPKVFDKRMEQMRETFIDELEKAFNSDANWLVEQFQSMPVEDFYELYKANTEMDFQLFYIMKYMDESQQNEELGRLERIVERYHKNDLNPLFEFRNK